VNKQTYSANELGVERVKNVQLEVLDVTDSQVVEYDGDDEPTGLRH